MKKRNAKKSFIESQKGSISKFLSKQNELRSSDEESELSNNSVSNEVTINENISPSESNLNDVDSNMPVFFSRGFTISIDFSDIFNE